MVKFPTNLPTGIGSTWHYPLTVSAVLLSILLACTIPIYISGWRALLLWQTCSVHIHTSASIFSITWEWVGCPGI